MIEVGINSPQGEIMSDRGPIGKFTRTLGHARVQSQHAQREQPAPVPKAQEKKRQLGHARAQSSGWGTQPTEKKKAIAVAEKKFGKLAGKSRDLPTKEEAIQRRHAKQVDERFDVAGSESSTDQDAGSEVETSIEQLRRDQSSEKSAEVVSPRLHVKIDMPKPLDFSNLPPLPSSPRPNTAEAAEGERAIIEQFRNYQQIDGGPSIEIGETADAIQTAITAGRVSPPPSTTTTTTTTTTTQSSRSPQAESKEKGRPGPVQTPREKPVIGHRPAPTPRGDDKSRAKPQESKKPGDPS